MRECVLFRTGHIIAYSSLCHQGYCPSSLCPRCHSTVETYEHILQCPDLKAHAQCLSFMQECIDKLSGAKTPTLLLNTLNYKWSLLLDLSPPVFEKDSSFNQLPACLISAIRHQNLIGWQTMLWGFTTWYWLQAYLTLCDFLQESPNPSWDVLITSTSIHYLYKNILDNRNKFLHGSTKSDQQQKLHLRVIQQVQAIYSNPLCLHH